MCVCMVLWLLLCVCVCACACTCVCVLACAWEWMLVGEHVRADVRDDVYGPIGMELRPDAR